MQPVFIYDAVRTPRARAKPNGALHSLTSLQLLQPLYQALRERTGFEPGHINDVILGCVSQYGEQAGNIARASVIQAGWPDHVPGMTLSRFCSSSLDAICVAMDRIGSGHAQQIIAGGVESMSRVPMQSDQPAWMLDFSEENPTRWVPIGICADLIATLEGYSREDLDRHALESQRRAQHASTAGYFDKSLIKIATDNGVVSRDENIRSDSSLQDLASLPPAFAQLGVAHFDARLLAEFPQLNQIEHQHTVANAPCMADAASAVLIADRSLAEQSGEQPRARLIAHRSYCGPVEMGLTGGTECATRLLQDQGLQAGDVDLVEFNEAFAGPTMKFIKDMSLSAEQVNVNGGAIALGHPMGATGGNLLGMLLDELERRDAKMGMVVICGATGSGTALLLTRATDQA